MIRRRLPLGVTATARAVAASATAGHDEHVVPATSPRSGACHEIPSEHVLTPLLRHRSRHLPAGQPTFRAAPHIPAVDRITPALSAPNSRAARLERLDRSEALTCDQDHHSPEQAPFHGDKIDRFTEKIISGCHYAPTASGIRTRCEVSLTLTLVGAA